MAELIGVGNITLTDLNDAIIAGSAPSNPADNALWIDSSGSSNILKQYQASTGRWVNVTLDTSILDPKLEETLTFVQETLGTIANDNLLTHSDRVILTEYLAQIIGEYPSTSTSIKYPSELPTVLTLDSNGSGSFARYRQTARSIGIGESNSYYNDLSNAYENLIRWLNDFTPRPWDIRDSLKEQETDLGANGGDTFREHMLEYYKAELSLSEYTHQVSTEGVSLNDKDEQTGNPAISSKSDDALTHTHAIQEPDNFNLLLDGEESYETNEYLLDEYKVIRGTLKYNTKYTITVWGELGSDRTEFMLYNGHGYTNLGALRNISKGIYQATFNTSNYREYPYDLTNIVRLYQMPSSSSSSSRIDKVMLNYGEPPVDFYPHPLDTKGKTTVNLLNREGELDGYCILNEFIAREDHAVMKDFIPVNPGETLTFSRGNNTSRDDAFRWTLLSENRLRINRIFTYESTYNWVVPEGVRYIQVSYNKNTNPSIEGYPRDTGFDIVSAKGNHNMLSNTNTVRESSLPSIATMNGPPETLYKGETYTYSVYIKSNIQTQSNYLFINNTLRDDNSFTIPTEWTRLSWTFTYNGGEYNGFQVRPHIYPNDSTTVYWKWGKLEKGSQATPWVPNESEVKYEDPSNTSIYKSHIPLNLFSNEKEKDEVYLDSVTNKWVLQKRAEKMFTGENLHFPKNYSFYQISKEISSIDYVKLTPRVSDYNYGVLMLSQTLERGKEYAFSADVEIDVGNTDKVAVLTRTVNNGHTIENIGNGLEIIDGEVFGTFIATGKEERVIFYAGIYGDTANKGVTYRHVKVWEPEYTSGYFNNEPVGLTFYNHLSNNRDVNTIYTVFSDSDRFNDDRYKESKHYLGSKQIYGVKALPTELPEDLQDKLNNIPSYEGSTYIYSDKGVTFNATFKSKGWATNFKLGQQDPGVVNYFSKGMLDGINESARPDANGILMYPITLSPNTTYSISTSVDKPMNIFIVDQNGTSSPENNVINGYPVTFTTDDSGIIEVGIHSDYTESILMGADYIQIERGDKVTDWKPHIQDTASKEDVDEVILNTDARIRTESDRILGHVTESYTTKGEFEDTIETQRLNITSLSDNMTLDFTNIRETIDTVDESLSSRLDTFNKYIRFDNGDIVLGEDNNSITLRIQNDRIQFLQNGQEVAYFSNNKFSIRDANIDNSLQLGEFSFVPLSDGSLDFK